MREPTLVPVAPPVEYLVTNVKLSALGNQGSGGKRRRQAGGRAGRQAGGAMRSGAKPHLPLRAWLLPSAGGFLGGGAFERSDGSAAAHPWPSASMPYLTL